MSRTVTADGSRMGHRSLAIGPRLLADIAPARASNEFAKCEMPAGLRKEPGRRAPSGPPLAALSQFDLQHVSSASP